MKETYVLKTLNDNKELTSITKKSFTDYKKNNLEKDYNNALINLIVKYSNISEKSKADFLSKKYAFGYLENEPYTGFINNKLIGLDSTFINSFSKVSNASFVYKKYHSVKDLTRALNNGDVDIAPNYYNYSGLSGSYTRSISPYDEEYVVLIHKNKTDTVINSVKSLNGKKVMTINSTLVKYLKKEAEADIISYDKISTLISKINKDSIVVLDKNIYEMYKDNKLSDFSFFDIKIEIPPSNSMVKC